MVCGIDGTEFVQWADHILLSSSAHTPAHRHTPHTAHMEVCVGHSGPLLSARFFTNERKLHKLLTEWSAPGNVGASSEAKRYAEALALPGADTAIDQLRWMYLAQQRPSGRAYLRESAHSVRLPVVAVRGESDPLLPARAWNKDAEFAIGDYRLITLPTGHFIPEEAPEAATQIILDFLR